MLQTLVFQTFTSAIIMSSAGSLIINRLTFGVHLGRISEYPNANLITCLL